MDDWSWLDPKIAGPRITQIVTEMLEAAPEQVRDAARAHPGVEMVRRDDGTVDFYVGEHGTWHLGSVYAAMFGSQSSPGTPN